MIEENRQLLNDKSMADFRQHLQGVADVSEKVLERAANIPDEEDNAHYWALRAGMTEGGLRAAMDNIKLLLRIYTDENK